PARLCGDELHAGEPLALELLRADGKRRQRTLHGRLSQLSAGGKPLAQPHDSRKRIHHAEPAWPRGRRDQKPAVVGSEVERGIEAFVRPVERIPDRVLPIASCLAGWSFTPGRRWRRSGPGLQLVRRCRLLDTRLTTPHKDAFAAALSPALSRAFYRLRTRIGESRFWPDCHLRPSTPGG